MANKKFTPIYDTDYVQKWYFDENKQDTGSVIIEHKTNPDGSSYIKYSDGTLICYKSVSRNCNINSEWGSLYRGFVALGNWPYEFKDTPKIQVSNSNTNNAMIAGFTTSPSKTSAGTVLVVRPVSSSLIMYIDIMGIGKWK